MTEMTTAVRQVVALGMNWPTLDPFLFCVHHRDDYPVADHHHGPAADLSNRPIGSDFEGIDGWRMYHGSVVPGFPAHPHRGFETITYVREGLVDHSDSMGAAARYGRGDVQWMTAGRGIVHAEMFPLLDRDGPNPLELFQIWLNLPASDKMVEPHFSMFWDADIPRWSAEGVEVTVVAGRLGDSLPPSPPPASWASRPDADVAIWHLALDAGANWAVPVASAGSQRVFYVFEGSVTIDGTRVVAPSAAVVDADVEVSIDADGRSEVLILQGRPLGEPVVQHGPFVMNTRAEIQQAFDDYQQTRFGGWPWERDDPVHGSDPDRFARRLDGRTDRPSRP